MKLEGLDSKDRRIIELLIKDGRMTYQDIASELGISRPAVKKRVTSLEEKGIIAGYRAVISPDIISGNNSYVVNLDISPGQFDDIQAELQESELVIALMQTTGKNHLMAICSSDKPAAINKFLTSLCRKHDGVENITTHAIMDIMKGLIIPE